MAKDDVKKTKVKLNTGMAGNILDADGRAVSQFSHVKGDVVELPLAEAQRFVSRGYAQRIEGE